MTGSNLFLSNGMAVIVCSVNVSAPTGSGAFDGVGGVSTSFTAGDFSDVGGSGGAMSGFRVPQTGQNAASSSNLLPHLGQNTKITAFSNIL